MAYDPDIVAKLSENIASQIKSNSSPSTSGSSNKGKEPPLVSFTPGEQARGLSGIGVSVNETPENKLRQLKMEEDEFNAWFSSETERRAKEQGVSISSDKKVMLHARQVYRTLLEQDAILNGYSVDFIMELRREHSAFRYSQGRYSDLRKPSEGTLPSDGTTASGSTGELQDRDADSKGQE